MEFRRPYSFRYRTRVLCERWVGITLGFFDLLYKNTVVACQWRDFLRQATILQGGSTSLAGGLFEKTGTPEAYFIKNVQFLGL